MSDSPNSEPNTGDEITDRGPHKLADDRAICGAHVVAVPGRWNLRVRHAGVRCGGVQDIEQWMESWLRFRWVMFYCSRKCLR